MAGRRRSVNRLLNPGWGNTDMWKLWDRRGREWSLHTRDLDESRTVDLYFDRDVQVAVNEHAAGLAWVEPADRSERWRRELQSRAFDPDWDAERGDLPFEVLEFRSDGDRLLLFYDHD